MALVLIPDPLPAFRIPGNQAGPVSPLAGAGAAYVTSLPKAQAPAPAPGRYSS